MLQSNTSKLPHIYVVGTVWDIHFSLCSLDTNLQFAD